jgi:hypothetical protein
VRPVFAALIGLSAALAALAALVCACETRPAGKPFADRSAAAGAEKRQGTPASPDGQRGATADPGGDSEADDAAIDATLPAALPLRAMGTVEPAPWLQGAERVAVVQVDARPFVIAAGTGWLRIYSVTGERVAEARGEGAAHVLEVMDLDRDGQAEIVIGRGLGREALQAGPSVTVYRFDGRALGVPRTLPMPETTRAQIIGVVADPGKKGRMWIGAFDSKYHVTVLEVEIDASDAATSAPRSKPFGRVRIPVAMASGDPEGDGRTDLIIARPYGDSLEAPGDVFILGEDGARKALPSKRGARAVVVSGPDILYADGWHREYARKGRALITRARRHGSAWKAEILVRVEGRHGYDRLRTGDVDGDGKMDAVAAGNGPAVLVRGLAPVTGHVPALGEVDATDIYVADIDGDGRDEVIIAGPSPGIWRLAQ